MKLTCSVARGMAGLVFTGAALAGLAAFGFVWTVVDAQRRRTERRAWSDVSDVEDYQCPS